MDMNSGSAQTWLTGAYFLIGLFSVFCLIFGWEFFFFVNLRNGLKRCAHVENLVWCGVWPPMCWRDFQTSFGWTLPDYIFNSRLFPRNEDLAGRKTLFGRNLKLSEEKRIFYGFGRRTIRTDGHATAEMLSL